MSKVYKATFQVTSDGFLHHSEQIYTELYEAASILKAKEMAEKEVESMNSQADDAYVPILTSRVICTLKDIERAE